MFMLRISSKSSSGGRCGRIKHGRLQGSLCMHLQRSLSTRLQATKTYTGVDREKSCERRRQRE